MFQGGQASWSFHALPRPPSQKLHPRPPPLPRFKFLMKVGGSDRTGRNTRTSRITYCWVTLGTRPFTQRQVETGGDHSGSTEAWALCNSPSRIKRSLWVISRVLIAGWTWRLGGGGGGRGGGRGRGRGKVHPWKFWRVRGCVLSAQAFSAHGTSVMLRK